MVTIVLGTKIGNLNPLIFPTEEDVVIKDGTQSGESRRPAIQISV